MPSWIGVSGSHQAAFLLACAIVLGGGGINAPWHNLAVEIIALVLLALNPDKVVHFLQSGPRALVWLVALTIAVPIIQLVPLPPAIWTRLPGSDIIIESYAVAGIENAWRPVSAYPARTLLAATGLIAPFCVLVLAYSGGRELAGRLALGVLAAGAVNMLLGAEQLVTANRIGNLYPSRVNPHHLYGTFANHNTGGLFLVVVVCALLALPPLSRRPSVDRMMRIVLAAIFSVGVVLTQSRSALALLLLVGVALAAPLGLARVKRLPESHGKGSSLPTRAGPLRLLLAAGAGLAIMLAAFGLAGNAKVGQTLARFDDLQDKRPQIWLDTGETIRRYFPVGAGVGSFEEVFRIDESLEFLSRGHINRAHNDYLEPVVESGVFGAAMILGWMAWCGHVLFGWYRSGRLRHHAFPALTLGIIALQSMIDYPLRSQAGLCVFAAMIAILANARPVQART